MELKLLKLSSRCSRSEKGMININGEEHNYLGYFDTPHAPEVGSYFINVEDNKLYRCDGYDSYGLIECKHKGCFRWFERKHAREIVITTYGTFLSRLVFPPNIALHIAKNNLTEINIEIPDDENQNAIFFKLNDKLYSSLTSMLYHAWYVWDMDYDKMVSSYGPSASRRYYNTDDKSLYWSIRDCNSNAILSPFLSFIGVHYTSVLNTRTEIFRVKKYHFYERFVTNPLPIDPDNRIFYDIQTEDFNRTIRGRVINDYELAELIYGCKNLEEALARLNLPADEFRYKTKSYEKIVQKAKEDGRYC